MSSWRAGMLTKHVNININLNKIQRYILDHSLHSKHITQSEKREISEQWFILKIVWMGTVYPSDKNQWVRTQIQWVKNCTGAWNFVCSTSDRPCPLDKLQTAAWQTSWNVIKHISHFCYFENAVSPNFEIHSKRFTILSVQMKFCQLKPSDWYFSKTLPRSI